MGERFDVNGCASGRCSLDFEEVIVGASWAWSARWEIVGDQILRNYLAGSYDRMVVPVIPLSVELSFCEKLLRSDWANQERMTGMRRRKDWMDGIWRIQD